jgi:NodT family efflux transporter outer membrane factor (OMF) lipoprotein
MVSITVRAPSQRRRTALHRLRLAMLAAAATALVACAPDLGPAPKMQPVTAFADQRSFTAPAANWPSDSWWKSYGDPQLDTLIAEGLAGAPDIEIAQARLREAQAAAQQAGSSLWPTLTGTASLQPTENSINETFPSAPKPQFRKFLPLGWHNQALVSANLDYQLDFLGKNRAALAAASRSDAQAAQIDIAAARLALSTSVAGAYADLVRLEADRNTARDAVRIRKESADLVESRVKQGLENEGQLSEARAEEGAAQADADQIDGAIAVSKNQIAALLGKGPDRGLDVTPPANPHVEALGLPPSLGVDLVGRRPDIVAARLRVEAAAKRIDVAYADFYPNIDITGYIGRQSLDVGDLLKHGSGIGQIGPALHLPIFNHGEIEGAYRGARAQYDEAVATYDKTLTNALHEVADAVVDQRALDKQLADSRVALTQSENAYRIARLRYQGGLSRYLDVLTAEDTLLAQRRIVADLEAQSFSQNVALVKALGGGFVSNS